MLNQSGRRVVGGLVMLVGVFCVVGSIWFNDASSHSIAVARGEAVCVVAIFFGLYWLITGGGKDRPVGG
jgi:hypothetical protein